MGEFKLLTKTKRVAERKTVKLVPGPLLFLPYSADSFFTNEDNSGNISFLF